jgi:hypothetical protein
MEIWFLIYELWKNLNNFKCSDFISPSEWVAKKVCSGNVNGFYASLELWKLFN